MSWVDVYTVEETGDSTYGIFNETTITGHVVFELPSFDAVNFYKDVMNEVYNQVKKDVESGYLKVKENK